MCQLRLTFYRHLISLLLSGQDYELRYFYRHHRDCYDSLYTEQLPGRTGAGTTQHCDDHFRRPGVD